MRRGFAVALLLTAAGLFSPAAATTTPQPMTPTLPLEGTPDAQPRMEAPSRLAALRQQGAQPVLVLERSERSIPSTGDPIWVLRVEIPGQAPRRFDAVSGRAYRQTANRHQLGSRAPLPQGHYRLGPVERLAPGAYPELGPVWIGIEPSFTTGRRVLGIHQDPSAGFGRNSGTLGCIGLIQKSDLLELALAVQAAEIRDLVVVN